MSPCFRSLIAALLAFSAWSQEPLLINGALDEGDGRNVPGWKLDGDGVQAVDYGLDDRHLFIKSDGQQGKVHVWWCQTIPVEEGQQYHLSFEGRAWGGADYNAYAGVAFLGQDGKWLSFQELSRVAFASPTWPGSNLPGSQAWKTCTGHFTVPRNAAKILLRFGLGSAASDPAEAGFRNLKLSEPPRQVKEVLRDAPGELPVYRVALKPVGADGVTLTPDWNLADAATLRSATRTTVCLNGLWAIQPDAGWQAPRADDWAFFKVPGYLSLGHGRHGYAVYGQADTTWAGQDIYNQARGIWYVREVAVPAGAGRKVFLDWGMTGLAARVYWNGKPVGEFTDQLASRADLSALAQPGSTGQLAIYALASGPESRMSFLHEAGTLPRYFSPEEFKRNWTRGFHDIYLVTEPAAPALGRVQVLPSVRTRSLGCLVLGGGRPALRYRIRVSDLAGKLVLDADAGSGTPGERGLSLSVPWAEPRLWSPDDPHLYSFQVQARGADGQVVDETLPERFGFREVWADGRNLMLNGHPLRLRPAQSDFFGPNLDNAAIRRDFAFMKDLGFNCAMRPEGGVNTHELEGSSRGSTDGFYPIADEMGMLVLSYTAYKHVTGGQFGGERISPEDITTLVDYTDTRQIQRLFNHPSVIAYSGFGDVVDKGINSLSFRSDLWGCTPLDAPGVLDGYDERSRSGIVKTMAGGRQFVRGLKAADPSRPFLAHMDSGESDGWGIFTYLNWTPTQEWEDYPRCWAKNGRYIIGATEHDLPYPSTFVNHGIPDGDGEPWITEYAALMLGDRAYLEEVPQYLGVIARTYDRKAGAYRHGISEHGYDCVRDAPVAQAVMVKLNRALYRAWRTYGVGMGIVPFGDTDNYVKREVLLRGDGTVVASPADPLKTPGGKLDRWGAQSYWTSEARPELPSTPTGTKPAGLTPLGELLHEVNSPLLAYVAGKPDAFTSKDHVFWSGETISKQVAVVWDGHVPRRFVAEWSASLGERRIASGSLAIAAAPGQIVLAPFAFPAPAVAGRADGSIELRLKDAANGSEVVRDVFAFQVYARDPALPAAKAVAIVDPSGESRAMLAKLGVDAVPVPVPKLENLRNYRLLVIGRQALDRMPAGGLDELPPDLAILILEQDDAALRKLGLRAFPIRSRLTYPLLRDKHPALDRVGAPDLSDWRVAPTLLPGGVEPLRDGYDYHNTYDGTVASVTIEVPTRGDFTPLIQSGFDLRETPLMEAGLGTHRVMFCQLSLVDGVGSDPVATRIAGNLVRYLLSGPRPAPMPLALVGDAAVAKAWGEGLGLAITAATAPAALPTRSVALVAQVPAAPAALAAWVAGGGTAVVLPQAPEAYAAIVPGLAVETRQLSLIPWRDLPDGGLLRGLGQTDFHYRQAIPQRIFNGKANLAEVAAGKGRWILLGFDPAALPIAEAPYLRLSQRHQYRALSQILANAGAALDAPVAGMLHTIGQAVSVLDVGMAGSSRIRDQAQQPGSDWIASGFDDAAWAAFDPAAKHTPYGRALVRTRFTVPADFAASDLVADLGTFDDYDQAWLNGVRIGATDPSNSTPDTAWSTRRIYPLPAGLLKVGQANVLAIHAWNRNQAKGWKAWVRGPLVIRAAKEVQTPYVGGYKHSDDPYLEHHW